MSTEQTLKDIDNGKEVKICCLRGEKEQCHRLREMGICEEAQIIKIAQSGALICNVCNRQLMISEELAENIIVEEVKDE